MDLCCFFSSAAVAHGAGGALLCPTSSPSDKLGRIFTVSKAVALFDAVGCELKAKMAEKCSDGEKRPYLTWILAFHVEPNNCVHPTVKSRRLLVLGVCWAILGEVRKKDVSRSELCLTHESALPSRGA